MTTREQIIAAASDAGLQLIWDRKLGREDYQSIMGSFPSLERFYAIAFAAGQESLRQQLSSSQKREVMLRDKVDWLRRYGCKDDLAFRVAQDALAANHLSGFVLCENPPVWTHSCNVLCLDNVELWIDKCPHCGKPNPKGITK